MGFEFNRVAFDRAAVWFIIAALPLALVGMLLYKIKMISAKVLIYVFGMISLIVGNLVFIWRAIPTLQFEIKLLFAVGATLLVLPFMVLGEILSRKRKMP